jgi:hypothetical protein
MNKTLLTFLFAVLSPAALAQTIIVSTLTQAPQIDGQDSDWDKVPAQNIMLAPFMQNSGLQSRELIIKAGQFQGQVFFYLQWPDNTENITHKTYVWNEEKHRYKKGTDLEDRLAMQFEISGEYSTDWPNAHDFVADTWHWKAARSNPLGLAHDKIATLSSKKLLRAASIPSPDGNNRYVFRESDEGTPLYKTLRYVEKEQDLMPKYELFPDPRGSIADVKAKGIWHNGSWHLELSRQLDTGHSDDARFLSNQTVRGGIAVFDASPDENHIISETLVFQF